MENFYHSIKEIETLAHLLQDSLSHEVFWARLRYDVDCSIDNALQLFKLSGMLSDEEFELQKNWRKRFQELSQNGKQILLYGCGVGRVVAELMLHEKEDFFGFCDRNAAKYKDGILEKPVFPPSYVLEHKDECYILITTIDYYLEIYQFLLDNQFPEDHILPYFCKHGVPFSKLTEQQYFDLLECYPLNTVFIDAGCFNCQTSIRFAEWCNGKYSKIIALEPDDKNFLSCKTIMQTRPIERMELIHAGLSNVSGKAKFSANANSSSFLIENDCSKEMQKLGHICGKIEEIHTIALDDMDIDEKIGFIKMDIEGAELQALQGAKRTLLRDKPLLAISVYHRKGDVLAIMDYLHETVPEYRFWLRHYSPIGLETVLYAAI